VAFSTNEPGCPFFSRSTLVRLKEIILHWRVPEENPTSRQPSRRCELGKHLPTPLTARGEIGGYSYNRRHKMSIIGAVSYQSAHRMVPVSRLFPVYCSRRQREDIPKWVQFETIYMHPIARKATVVKKIGHYAAWQELWRPFLAPYGSYIGPLLLHC
jgi:hypothetical protein